MKSFIAMKSLVPIMSLSAVAAFAGSTQAAPSGFFKYFATNIPQNYGTCAQLTENLVSAIETNAQARVIGQSCEAHSGNLTIEITYSTESGKPLELTSTRDLASTDADGRGFLPTREECDSRMAEVVDKFKSATGLNPFLTYCTQDRPSAISHNPWHVAIDAFGNGRQKYFLASRLSAYDISGNSSEFTQRVADHFAARANTTLVDVKLLRDSMRMQRLVVSLFAESRVSLGIQESISVKTVADCEEESVAFGVAAAQASGGIITYGCKKTGMTSQHTPFVIYEGISREFLSVIDTGITFATMSDCKAKRDMTLRHLQDVVGTSVTGVLCDNSREKTRAFAVEIQSTP
jgi:hypothetical protein